MPCKPYSPTQCVDDHIRVTYKKSKRETYEKYRSVLYNINSILRENGLEMNPRHITEDDIGFLLEYWEDKAISTRNWYLHIMNRYLQYYKNDVIEKMEIELGYDRRPHADWLSEEDCTALMECEKTPLEDLVIHLELCMGLRVSEVVRLRVKDIHFDEDITRAYISVRGKGRGEGKWRSIPFHPESEHIFKKWLEVRSEMVQRCRDADRSWVAPDNLLIWCHYVNCPVAGPYTERGHSLDRAVIHKVRGRLGFHFGNHTLRRTFGHNLYHAGVPIETISKLYGHEDIVTTMHYIGVDLDDMSGALQNLYRHQISMSQQYRKR